MKTRLSAACAALLLAGSACSSASEEADGGKPKANPGAVASAQASGASQSSSPTSAAPTPGPSAASSSSAPRKSASPVAPTDWLAEGSQSDGFPTDAGHAFPSSSRVGSHPGYERVVVQYTGGAADLTWKTTFSCRSTSRAFASQATSPPFRRPSTPDRSPDFRPSRASPSSIPSRGSTWSSSACPPRAPIGSRCSRTRRGSSST